MTWEQPGETGGRRRWLWPTAVLAGIVVVAAVLLIRTDGTGTLTIGPTAGPSPTGRAAPSIDPADFELTQLGRLREATERAGDRPLLPDGPNLTLVTTTDQGVRVIDLATGDSRHMELLTEEGQHQIDPWNLFAVGDHIVSNADPDVVRISPPDMRLVRLARDSYALPSFDDATVWVLKGANLPTVVQLRLDGTIADRVEVPPVAQPLAGTEAGVLLSTPNGIHIASGDQIRRITGSGQLVAVGADQRLAWLDCAPDLSCQIVIGTFDDPEQVRVPIARTEVPGGYAAPLGQFSPDGRRIAVPLLRYDADPAAPTQTTVAINDIASGAEAFRVAASPEHAVDGMPLDWSSDSRLLFVGLGTSLSVWNADTGAVTQLDVGGGQILGLVVTRG